VAPTPDVGTHNSFQDGQAFLDNGGYRGPQESVLRPGTYYINPYLFSVVSAPLTVIRQGEVGVLISNIGGDPADLLEENSATAAAPLQRGAKDPEESRIDKGVRTRHVVPEGFRGIQRNVLGPGKYNINPRAFTVIPIPTTTRSVEWGGDVNDDNFDPFQVVSHDGFEMRVEVRCQYRILPENAPYVVQKLGSIEDLEANVIHPQIDGIFRAQVSKSPAISYQQNRAEEQTAAEKAVRDDLSPYKVEVVSVMITNIHLPEALMKTTQEKNLAEQRKSMFDAQEQAEKRRIEFQKTKSQADQQDALIKAEVGIAIAKHEASQAEERARGTAAQIRIQAEAEASRDKQIGDAEAAIIRAKGEAQAEAYRRQVEALTSQGVTMVEVTKAIATAGLKITPDVVVGGSSGGDGGGLVNLLLANMLREQRISMNVLPPDAASAGSAAPTPR
jgi:regulator of protease activity HflC (stomatin/prohibitin superfamily)